MELLGRSVEEYFQRCKKRLSLKSVLLLADQMVKCLEQLHAKHYIHRDIKSENFVMGLKKKSSDVFLIDFGLSKRFRDPVSGLHIPYQDHKSFTGTARYASINTHMGIEQSRRDDLESLGHLFIYLLKGILPWQNLQAANKKEKYEKILQKKINTPIELLCDGLPSEFSGYLNYCRKMKFNERPDYAFILRLFKDLFIQQGYFYDMIYDWSLPFQSFSQTLSKKSIRQGLTKKPVVLQLSIHLGSKENYKTPQESTEVETSHIVKAIEEEKGNNI